MPASLMLAAGETQHGLTSFRVSRFYSMNVGYRTNWVWGGGLLLSAVALSASAVSNAASKSRAENEAQAQWRDGVQFEGADAMMLRGPWAPWLTVVIYALKHGTPWHPSGHGSIGTA